MRMWVWIVLVGLGVGAETPAPEKLADEIISYLRTRVEYDQPSINLLRALPRLVTEKHFQKLVELLSTPVEGGRRWEVTRHLTLAIARTRAPEARDYLLNLLPQREMSYAVVDALVSVGQRDVVVGKLKSLLQEVSPPLPREDILNMLSRLGDDSDLTLRYIDQMEPRRQVDYLSRLHSSRSVERLIKLLREPKVNKRNVMRALSRITLLSTKTTPQDWEEWWQKDGRNFVVPGSSPEDIPRLLKVMNMQEYRPFRWEIEQRLRHLAGQALPQMIALMRQSSDELAYYIGARLISMNTPERRKALIEYARGMQKVPSSLIHTISLAIARDVESPPELQKTLDDDSLPSEVKNDLLALFIPRRNTTDYLQLYRNYLTRLKSEEKVNLLTVLIESNATEAVKLAFEFAGKLEKNSLEKLQYKLQAGWARRGEARAICVQLLKSSALSPYLLRISLKGLQGRELTEQQRKTVISLFNSSNEEVRLQAISFARDFLLPGDFQYVRELLQKEKERWVVNSVVGGLLRVVNEDTIELLLTLLKSANDIVASSSAIMLTNFERESIKDRTVAELLARVDNLNPSVLSPVLAWCLRMAPDRAVEAVLRVGRRPGVVRYGLLLQLGKAGNQNSLPLLKKFLSSKDTNLRCASALSLLHLGVIAGEEEFGKVLASGRDSEIMTALYLARQSGFKEAVPLIIDLLEKTKAPALRDYALGTLKELTGQRLPADAQAWRSWYRSATGKP